MYDPPGASRRSVAAALVIALRQQGVHLAAFDGTLRFRAPPGVLDAELRARLTELREEIIALLTGLQPGGEPLSDRQLRIWLIHQRQGSTTEYQMGAAFRLRGPLDVDRLGLAVDAVVQQHPALRQVVTMAKGLPVLVTSPHVAHIQVVEMPSASEYAVRQVAAEIVTRPMDLTSGPLVRVALIRLSEDDHVSVLVAHHIISDDYSIRLICGQILECYATTSDTGQPPGWAATAVGWGRRPAAPQATAGSTLAKLLQLRRETLRAAGAPQLPSPRTPVNTPPWAGCSSVAVLEHAAREEWESGRRSAGVTTLALTLALTALAVAASGGPTWLLIATPCSGRETATQWQEVGYHATTIVVQVSVGIPGRFADLLDRVMTDVSDALAVRHMPYEAVVGNATHSRLGGHVLWVVTYAAEPWPRIPGLVIEPLPLEGDEARHDLRVALVDQGGHLEIRVTHRLSTVDAGFTRAVAVALDRLYRDVPAGDARCDQIVRDLRQRPGAVRVRPDPPDENLAEVARRRRNRRAAAADVGDLLAAPDGGSLAPK
jgi:hypothetical protein